MAGLPGARGDPGRRPRRVFFGSRAADYAQGRGGRVDETSPAEPVRFNGSRLLEAEALLREAPFESTVLRFAGIYGPGRTRLLDVLDCGGFRLAEYSDALVELFEPGRHLDCYRNLEELLEKVEYYLEHPEETASIALAGMEAVRNHHTIGHRARHMILHAGLQTPEAAHP